MVPALTGHEPVNLSFLWSQHNEHRIPVPKLIFLALSWPTRGDSRAGMFFNLLALAAASLALVVCAWRLRGRISYTDGFFPVACLNLSQYQNLIWNFQIQLITATNLACALLLMVAWRPASLTLRSALWVTALLLCLALSGASGLVFVPPLAAWLIWTGWRQPRQRRGKSGRRDWAIPLCGASAIAVFLLYFYHYQQPQEHPLPSGLLPVGRACIEFLSVSVGLVGEDGWPYSGLAVFALYGATLALLLRALKTVPGERQRAAGLLAFLLGTGMLALSVGLGRGGFGPGAAFASRYVTLSIPLLCCVYLVWGLYARPLGGRACQAGLFLVLALTSFPSGARAFEAAAELRRAIGAFEGALVRGVPPERLADRYWPVLYPDRDILAQRLSMLRETRMGPYR